MQLTLTVLISTVNGVLLICVALITWQNLSTMLHYTSATVEANLSNFLSYAIFCTDKLNVQTFT